MGNRTSHALALLLAAAACGGGVTQAPMTVKAGPADAAARRALLAQYSPEGEAIVATFEALPGAFQLPEGEYKVSFTGTFDGYFRESSLHMLVTHMDTGVHETTHGYVGAMAFQLCADRGVEWGEGAIAIVGDGEPWLVRLTDTFPSEEMDATFPADARGMLHGAYIVGQSPNLATQKQGIYGLLDEYSAFYQGSRTALDFWPWVQAQRDAKTALEYVVVVDSVVNPFHDFTLFILHWLVHARDHHPEMYEAALANADLRGAFRELHAAYGALAARAEALLPTVRAFADDLGAGELIMPTRSEAARAHLEEEVYRAMLAELTGGGT